MASESDRGSTAHILFHIRLCYRLPLPPMSMNDIQRILQVLDKYMVERTPAEVSQALTAELDENPLNVYAIACRYNLHGIANLAAKTLLKLPCSRLYGLDEGFSTLMTVEQYERLVKYRILAGKTAVHATRNFPRSDIWAFHLASPTYHRRISSERHCLRV